MRTLFPSVPPLTLTGLTPTNPNHWDGVLIVSVHVYLQSLLNAQDDHSFLNEKKQPQMKGCFVRRMYSIISRYVDQVVFSYPRWASSSNSQRSVYLISLLFDLSKHLIRYLCQNRPYQLCKHENKPALIAVWLQKWSNELVRKARSFLHHCRLLYGRSGGCASKPPRQTMELLCTWVVLHVVVAWLHGVPNCLHELLIESELSV